MTTVALPLASATELRAQVVAHLETIERLNHKLAEAVALRDMQAESLQHLRAALFEKDGLIVRLKDDLRVAHAALSAERDALRHRDAAVSAQELAKQESQRLRAHFDADRVEIARRDERAADAEANLGQLAHDLVECRNANAALQQACALKDREIARLTRELEGANAEIESLYKYPDDPKIMTGLLTLRRECAQHAHDADVARGALVGLAYRLGQLENDRLTRDRNRAADLAVPHHSV